MSEHPPTVTIEADNQLQQEQQALAQALDFTYADERYRPNGRPDYELTEAQRAAAAAVAATESYRDLPEHMQPHPGFRTTRLEQKRMLDEARNKAQAALAGDAAAAREHAIIAASVQEAKVAGERQRVVEASAANIEQEVNARLARYTDNGLPVSATTRENIRNRVKQEVADKRMAEIEKKGGIGKLRDIQRDEAREASRNRIHGYGEFGEKVGVQYRPTTSELHPSAKSSVRITDNRSSAGPERPDGITKEAWFKMSQATRRDQVKARRLAEAAVTGKQEDLEAFDAHADRLGLSELARDTLLNNANQTHAWPTEAPEEASPHGSTIGGVLNPDPSAKATPVEHSTKPEPAVVGTESSPSDDRQQRLDLAAELVAGGGTRGLLDAVVQNHGFTDADAEAAIAAARDRLRNQTGSTGAPSPYDTSRTQPVRPENAATTAEGQPQLPEDLSYWDAVDLIDQARKSEAAGDTMNANRLRNHVLGVVQNTYSTTAEEARDFIAQAETYLDARDRQAPNPHNPGHGETGEPNHVPSAEEVADRIQTIVNLGDNDHYQAKAEEIVQDLIAAGLSQEDAVNLYNQGVEAVRRRAAAAEGARGPQAGGTESKPELLTDDGIFAAIDELNQMALDGNAAYVDKVRDLVERLAQERGLSQQEAERLYNQKLKDWQARRRQSAPDGAGVDPQNPGPGGGAAGAATESKAAYSLRDRIGDYRDGHMNTEDRFDLLVELANAADGASSDERREYTTLFTLISSGLTGEERERFNEKLRGMENKSAESARLLQLRTFGQQALTERIEDINGGLRELGPFGGRFSWRASKRINGRILRRERNELEKQLGVIQVQPDFVGLKPKRATELLTVLDGAEAMLDAEGVPDELKVHIRALYDDLANGGHTKYANKELFGYRYRGNGDPTLATNDNTAPLRFPRRTPGRVALLENLLGEAAWMENQHEDRQLDLAADAAAEGGAARMDAFWDLVERYDRTADEGHNRLNLANQRIQTRRLNEAADYAVAGHGQEPFNSWVQYYHLDYQTANSIFQAANLRRQQREGAEAARRGTPVGV